MKCFRVHFQQEKSRDWYVYETEEWKDFLQFMASPPPRPFEIFLNGYLADAEQVSRILSQAATVGQHMGGQLAGSGPG